ncbi:MAG: DUF4334 domain-containing protein [Bacteroidota bacterium]
MIKDPISLPTHLDEALVFFDSLPPVSLDFMWGEWEGAEQPTGHPMDGLLGATGWYGKQFVDAETVHPLLFHNLTRTGTFKVNPALVPLSMYIPKWNILHAVINLIRPVVHANKPKARLRMLEYRGKISATMIYDRKPIHDTFRKIDDDTLLGLMDFRGMEGPYFFLLKRK